MVRAIIEGRKTQTRRALNPQPRETDEFLSVSKSCKFGWKQSYCSMEYILSRCPYGQAGDRLWVRESARVINVRGGFREIDIEYQADNKFATVPYPARLAPAPLGKLLANGSYREASRIFLEIDEVRIERIQDITGNDVKSEGVEFPDATFIEKVGDRWNTFQTLWDSINSKRGFGWDKNPYVWVVKFHRITP